MMRYQIYRTYTRFIPKFSLLSPFLQFSQFSSVWWVSKFPKTFFLTLITGVKVVKTNISFWLLFLRTSICWSNSFSFGRKSILCERSYCFFFEKNVEICSRRVLASNLSSFIMVPRIFLVVLVFFLMSERWSLLLRYISRRGISKFILFGVFILFFWWFIFLETVDINLSNA